MIYVDTIRTYDTPLKYKQWCHMVTDGTIEELHQFAARLGLKKAWFQSGDEHPIAHYDLTPTKRSLAIQYGAQEIATADIVHLTQSSKTHPTRVVHCKQEHYDIYIGRTMPKHGLQDTGWGNPFKSGMAITNYRAWLMSQYSLLKRIPTLQGKILGCWCKTKNDPLASCHGDILAELADADQLLRRIEWLIAKATRAHCHMPIWEIVEQTQCGDTPDDILHDLLKRNIIVETIDYYFQHVPTQLFQEQKEDIPCLH
jgi:hypothetical protein